MLLALLCFFISFSTYAAENISQQSTRLSNLLNDPAFIATIKKINNKNKHKHYSAQQTETEELGIPVGEDLLLSLYVGKYYISDLFAYKTADNAKISLMSLFELLDFMITVDIKNKNASGWFINEENIFDLRLPENGPATVNINNKETLLNQENFFIEGDDIYVDADVISAWFGLTFTFDFSLLKLQVSSKTPLPIEQKIARSKKKIAKKSYNATPTLPWKPSNYQTISTPLLDFQLGGTTNQTGNQYGFYSVLGQNDLAYFSSSYYLSGNNTDALTDLRLTLSKEDSESTLLGPLKASQYKFGDVTPVKTAIGSTATISRGFVISNKNINQVSNSRTKTFSGDIQPGWDIELYRNDILVGRQTSLTSGRYDFNDIDLLFGDNQFKLVFYGPQGQVKTEQEQVYIGANQSNEQASQYAFSLVESGKKLFNVSDYTSNTQPGWLSTITYEHGISDNISLHAGLESLFADEGDDVQRYSIGTNIDLFERWLINLDLQTDQDQHLKGDVNLRTKYGNHAFSLNYNYIDAFQTDTDEDLRQSVDIGDTQTITFDMNGRILTDTFIPLNYQNKWIHRIRSYDGSESLTSDTLSNQITFSSHIGTIINALSYSTTNQSDEPILNGFIRYQTALGPLYSRLQTSYNIKPDVEALSYSWDLSLPFSNYVDSQLGLAYQENNDKLTSTLSLNWIFDKVDITTYGKYDNDSNWTAGFNTRFSFGYEPTTDEFFISNRAFSSTGTLMARVFVDDNLNGSFDEGEETIEGVRVKAVQSRRQGKTNESGIATISSLKKNKRTDIVIDKRSIDDPFIIPATPGVSLTPRTGIINTIDIPMVNASELEGTVYLRDGEGNEKTGNYLTVNLYNSDGDKVATTESEFDGYYLFTDLLPGKYTVSIASSDIKRKNLHEATPLELDFSAAGEVIAGADFLLDKYTKVDGYVIELGEFDSLLTLKTFWLLIKGSYNDALEQQVFYIEDPIQKKYQLNAAFFERESQAERACDYLLGEAISCSVKEFEFNL